jgi:starch phosphorylase
VLDYVEKLYRPARDQRRRMEAVADGVAGLAAWKQRVRECWAGVAFEPLTGESDTTRVLHFGDALNLQVSLRLNGLQAQDVVVECLLGEDQEDGGFVVRERLELTPSTSQPGTAVGYGLALRPTRTGLQRYRIRAYPYHTLLAHRFELGCMKWL